MKKSLLFSFSLMGSIGFAVAIPLVSLALLGRYLDKAFDSSPKLFIAMIALSTVLVYFILKKIVKDATDKFKKLS